MLKHRSSLAMMACLAIVGTGAALAAQSGVARTAASPPRPRGVVRDQQIKNARAREVAEWNAAVDRRKAEKRHRLQQRIA